MANLQDIATASNVSTATVSRILSGDSSFRCSDATRKKVVKVAEELGYLAQKNISTEVEKTWNFGFIQMYTNEELKADPYYAQIERCLEQQQKQYNFHLFPLNHDILSENTQIKENIQLDGIFAIGIYTKKEIALLEKISPNLVIVDSDSFTVHNCVFPDFLQGVHLALDFLIEKGHTKIGFIGESYIHGLEKEKTLEPRLVFFQSYLQAKNLFFQENVIKSGNNVKIGYESTLEFFKNRRKDQFPTAFFISSDTSAAGVIRGILESGLKIPEDISLIAFNNSVLSEYSVIPLTSISVSPENIAEMSVKQVFKQINKDYDTYKIIIPCSIVERESVCSLK